MEPIIFATYVTDKEWLKHCAKPLERSFKFFHPNIPFKIFRPGQVNKIFCEKNETRNIRFSKPFLGEQLKDKYKKIVLLDADQLIVGPLTELLTDESELAGVRSNDDTGISLSCYSFETPKISWKEYLNCGLCSISNPEAWDVWKNLNNKHKPYMRDAEQGCWNELFHSKKFSATLLDPIDKDVIYGTAANFHLWNKLSLNKKDQIVFNFLGKTKQVKILHRAGSGGIGTPFDKFKRNLFSPAIARYLDLVTS
jgi:hypothetical protein